MSSSSQLRSEIGRLESKVAASSAAVAKAEKAAGDAREAARKKRDTAGKSKSASTVKSALTAAGREDNKVAAAEAAIAKARKDGAAASKTLGMRKTSLANAEAQERKALINEQKTTDSRRRTSEIAHAREVGRLSSPSLEVRYVAVREPQVEGLRVLYLTANPESVETVRTLPDGTRLEEGVWLRVDREVRAVQATLRSSKYRDLVELRHAPAATFSDLISGLNDFRPHIVHFSGHAGAGGVFMDNESGDETGHDVDFDLLAEALGATDEPPRLLVLNACDSLTGVEVVLSVVPVVVGMADSILDETAIVFASSFYAALASAQSVQTAVSQAKVLMLAASLDGSDLPEMRHRDDVDPGKVVLVRP